MTLSPDIQNLSNSNPVPKHQSIGKNGSFWLPKDSPEVSKQSSFKSKSSHGKSSASAKSVNSKQTSGNHSALSTDRLNSNFEKSILTAQKKITSQSKPSGNSLIMKGANSKLGKLLTNKVRLLPIKNNIAGKAVTVNATSAVPLVSVKEQIKTTFLNNSPKQNVDRDSDFQDRGKKKKNHGAKNAQTIASMDSYEKDSLSQSTTIACSPILDSSTVAKFVDFIGKSVAPRVAYTNKFAKKVVRFAIDLPNGSKLGVRLEKSEKGVSLCFIAPDDSTKELLKLCENGIQGKFKSDDNFQTKVYIFSDYQEMDDYFLKAA
jgi:hypothetical protein